MRTPWSTSFRYWVASLLVVLLVALLWFVRELLSPLIIGALLAFVINPVITFLQRGSRLSKSSVVTIGLLFSFGLIVALVATLTPALVSESQVLAADIQQVLADIQDFVSQPVVILGLAIDFQSVLPDFSNLVNQGIATFPENALNLLQATGRNLIWTLVVIATTYFLLRDWERLRSWVFGQIPQTEQEDARQLYARLKTVWLGYFRGNLALMVIVGVVFSIVWPAIGLPGGVILAAVAGLLTIIPDLGPAISAAFAVVIALVEGSNTLPISNVWFALLVLAIYLVLINSISLLVRPRIFARSVHMHGGLVFIAIMAAAVLEGVLAAIIVVPLMASAGIMFRYLYRRLQNLDPFA